MRKPTPKPKPNLGRAEVITDTTALHRLLFCGSTWVAPYRGPQRPETTQFWRAHAPHLVDPRPEEDEEERLMREDTWLQYQGRVAVGTYMGDPEKDLVNSVERQVRQRREKERFDWLSERGLIGGEALALIERREAVRKRLNPNPTESAKRCADLAARDRALGLEWLARTDKGEES